MKTPSHLFNQTATLSVPNDTRDNNMDVQLTYTTSTIRCRIEDPSGTTSLQNQRVTGETFSKGVFAPNCGATKDSLLTITAGTKSGKKYRFRSPLMNDGARGDVLWVADLESVE